MQIKKIAFHKCPCTILLFVDYCLCTTTCVYTQNAKNIGHFFTITNVYCIVSTNFYSATLYKCTFFYYGHHCHALPTMSRLKVREAASILSLKLMVYPCPKEGTRFRPKVMELGGKTQFPYMVDPNTGVSMYESDDIIMHMFGNYGSGNIPLALRLGVATTISASIGSLWR